jgi:glycosyltransferase involved in cell wall biosynthesis
MKKVRMKRVLLIHQGRIQHYRVPVYNYLHEYLARNGFDLTVVSEGVQDGCDCNPTFPLHQMPLRLFGLATFTVHEKPDAVILFVNHRNKYLFPLILFLKIVKVKSVTWTHGLDLQRKHLKFSALLHHLEHFLCDGILLYAGHISGQIMASQRGKISVANNTLNLTRYDGRIVDKNRTLNAFGISTRKNIICVGRIQKRKRIDDLIAAFDLLTMADVGLVLAGPDDENLAASLVEKRQNVFSLGPLYGDKIIDLMRACDVYCIPGAIGLSIVDAQYCGLPVVTEDVDHGPEIMYLKNGINGFIVPKGDTQALAEKLRLLLTDNDLRKRFSEAAKKESATNAHIDRLCEGFVECLSYIASAE